MKGSKQSFIGNVCIAVFLLISAGFILYIANVSPTFKSQIELQKHNKKYFDNLDEEKLSIVKSRKLFEKRETTDNSMLLREIGPIPDGKFVSSFKGEGEGTHIYHEKYRAYGKRAIYYVDKEPRRNYDGSLVRDYFGDVMYEEVEKVRYVTEPYWAYEPKEVPFKYAYSLTTFDLSDSISSNAPDSVYEKLTQQFAIQLGSYKNYKFSPSLWKCNNNNDWDTWYGKTLPKNRQAIAYVAKDQQGVSVLRYVFFANQRAYMLEMHSEYQLESKAKRILESVTSFYLQDYNDMVDKKLLFVVLGSFLFVVLGLACLLIPKLSLRRKGISMPTSEKWLCRYIYVAWLVNVVCVFADIYSVYTGEIKQDGSWWSYFLLFLCAVGMNIYTNAYIINKVKVEHGFDYFVPKWLKAYLVNRHVTDAEYKSVVVFLLYPFFILGNLPLGLCVLCYVLPVSLLSMVLLEFRNFSKWSNGEGEKDSQLKDIEYGTFKDYYLLLDIDRGVSEEEVDKAFNRAMAKYHSGVDSGLYTEAYKRNVQEAYRVLSSVNRLRPEYDKEFDVYRASNKPEYQYSDEKTKKDIMLVQKELYGGIMQKINIKRGKTYNSVVRGIYLFLLLLVIAAIVLLKHTNGRSNDYRNRRSSDYRESLWDKIDVDIPFVDIKM